MTGSSVLSATTPSSSVYHPGDTVWTTYGAGVIVEESRHRYDADNTVTSTTTTTTVAFDDNNSMTTYTVRLWRIPGKSIASASWARLGSSAIIGHIPVAPGMYTYLQSPDDNNTAVEGTTTTTTNRRKVLVLCYYSNRRTFLVQEEISSSSTTSADSSGNNEGVNNSPIVQQQQQFWEVSYNQIIAGGTSAKFYPLLESLMIRANHAATAAITTATQIMRQNSNNSDPTTSTQPPLLAATQQAVQTLRPHIDQLLASSSPSSTNVDGNDSHDDDKAAANNVSSPLHNIVQTVEKAAPEMEATIKQFMTMIKDEELTVLLEKCKQRLEKIVISKDDISSTTRMALEKTGIHINWGGTNNDEESSDNQNEATVIQSIESSQKAALSAIQQLLKQISTSVDGNSSPINWKDATRHFTEAFDTLSNVAKSDRSLQEAFQSIVEKTTSWQAATGRLLTTRSASLFLEGASRIQARAVAILTNEKFASLGEIGSKLTKSFTERDAALSRLKSIELGEAVKSRLIEAIEVRSESLGGLDGIIAGALSAGKRMGDSGGNQIQDMLQQLQRSASTATVDAHETLLTILASRSMYRDAALLRLEQTLCDLGDRIGNDLSPDEIAAIVRGEGGTARLFEPIARSAMEQIEKQLDAAESQIKDETVLEVLKRIRKLMSGELTLNAVLDDIVNALNDEKVVRTGESIVQHSEQVLDAIEGVSASKAVTDAIQIAEKAGITKETVMREFERLNMDNLLGVAQQAVTDEKARQNLLSSATDTALDFVLRILPSMPVPPFEGVKDGLVYHISNLSMKGFRVRKEDIHIELAGMRATKHTKETRAPSSPSAANHVSYGVPHLQKSASIDSQSSDMEIERLHTSVKATELLIIEIHNTSAVLDNAAWSFEQTYMPYLKGGGIAHAKMSGGSIRLQFELRRRRKQQSSDDAQTEWEPVLCLHDRSCSIAEVDLSLDGDGRITWILNKLAALFKAPLRDFVVSSIVKVLSSRSGWILERLNKILSPYWDLILRTAKLQMEDLVEADEDVIVSEEQVSETPLIELVWRERLPLGMNLLVNDESGLLKVVDFPRGSQARIVCEKRGFEPDAFKGASVGAVNGSYFEDQEELFDALKDPGRPKTVLFRLADTADAERLRKLIEGAMPTKTAVNKPRDFALRKVAFNNPGELGIEFGVAMDNSGLVVNGFVEGEGGIVLAAERSCEIRFGDLLTHINDEPVFGLEGDDRLRTVHLLESVATTPQFSLTFSDYYMHKVYIKKIAPGPGLDCSGGPTELALNEKQEGDKRRVVLKGFNSVSGMAEAGGILIGDHLVFVNGFPVGAGCRWLDTPSITTMEEVLNMLKNQSFYPIGLTFARPLQHSSRWTLSSQGLSDTDVETICITAESYDRLGVMFEHSNQTDIVVSDFQAVPGMFQRAMHRCTDENGNICLSIDAIDGQFVPSYATVEMVRNALDRSWKGNDGTELLLCDDELKQWLMSRS